MERTLELDAEVSLGAKVWGDPLSAVRVLAVHGACVGDGLVSIGNRWKRWKRLTHVEFERASWPFGPLFLCAGWMDNAACMSCVG